jgi:hypothetical protein
MIEERTRDVDISNLHHHRGKRGVKIAPPLKLTLFDLVEYFIAEADGSCI